jgi:type IV secretion system protein VirD4
VHILDPFHIVQGIVTAGYNPLDEMGKVAEEDEDRAVSYAGKLAEALVTKLSEQEKYWDAASETFLRGLILLVYLTEPPQRRNLVRVRDLLVEGDAEAFAAMMESAPTKKGTAFELLLERMYACAKRGEVGAAIAKAARSMEKMGEKQMGSVLTNAMEHTAFLDTPEMRKVCRGSSFLISDLKSKAMTVYLCLPLTAVTGKEGRWLRMFVLLFIDMMQRSAFTPITPVLLAIDEFPSLGGIETVAPYMRSFGVRFWAVAQDFEQLKKVYPASWQGFLGGAEAIQCMGIAHWQTVELMAQMLSSHVVMEQQEGYGPGSVRNVGVVHPLLDPAQVSRILAKGLNNQIVLRAGRKPMLLKICPYFDYMPWWYYNPSLDPRHIPEAWRRRFWRRRS